MVVRCLPMTSVLPLSSTGFRRLPLAAHGQCPCAIYNIGEAIGSTLAPAVNRLFTSCRYRWGATRQQRCAFFDPICQGAGVKVSRASSLFLIKLYWRLFARLPPVWLFRSGRTHSGVDKLRSYADWCGCLSFTGQMVSIFF